MVEFQKLVIDAKAVHEVIVMPQFGDVIDENGNIIIPASESGDWMIIDNVPYRVPIIQIVGNKNLLKRRDATCKLIATSLGTMSNRYIITEKLYIRAENCQQELYQGAFRDWESRSDVFREKAIEFLQKAAGVDIYSNKWFGWTGRAPNASWSLNRFDGIWHWLAAAITDLTIPAAQTVDLGATAAALTDALAYAAIKSMIDAQDDITYNLDDDDKCIYIDKKWLSKIWRYLISVGTTTPVLKADGLPATPLFIEGIQIKPMKWNPLLFAIFGSAAHAGILTLKGQFLLATDSIYGKGPDNAGPAITVWYDPDDDVTRWEFHVKLGTQLSIPSFSVVATTTGLLALL